MTNVWDFGKELMKAYTVNQECKAFKTQKVRNYFKSKGRHYLGFKLQGRKKQQKLIEKAYEASFSELAAFVHMQIYQEKRETTISQKLQDIEKRKTAKFLELGFIYH